MEEIGDTELVRLCLNGEKSAFDTLVRRYQDAVFNLAWHMSGSREDAADMTQVAFVKAYQRLCQYKTGHSFRNWVMGICANSTKNRFRSVMRRRNTEETYLELHEYDSRPNPRAMKTRELLNKMPENLRVPLALKYMEGLTHQEIAEVLNISLGTSKMRVKRASDELRYRLNRDESGQKQ